MTNKEELFCIEYLKDFNASKAAIRAGYSEKTSYAIGYENLKKPHISQKISELKNKISEIAEISILGVALELKTIYENKEEKSSDRIKAIETVSKLLGLNEAEKTEVKLITDVLPAIEVKVRK
jgi:phage terminase small subunit